MNESTSDKPPSLKELRDLAYEKLRKKYPDADGMRLHKRIDSLSDVSLLSEEDLPGILHELQVYQIELEMQNEELRRVSSELEEARDKYRDLYDCAPVGYISVDGKGRIVSANKRAQAMLEPEGEIEGRTFSAFVAGDYAKTLHLHLEQARLSTGKTSTEVALQAARGDEIRYVLLEATASGVDNIDETLVNMTLTDITERRLAEQALERSYDELEQRVEERTAELRESNRALRIEMKQRKAAQEELRQSEARLRAIFDSARDVIIIKDKHLRIQEVNPAFGDLFGVPAADAVGKRAADFLPRESAKRVEAMDNRALNGNVVEFEHTERIGGRETTFLDIRVPLGDSAGRVTGLCVIARDMTERRRASSRMTVKSAAYPSDAMKKVFDHASKVARTDGIVLLQGESGSGKDYLAQWIHDHSHRADASYFAINCAALTAELAESELFGHEPGAFTGARGRKRGLLELAEGGSILLNEIGELPLQLQSKLLTFLDTKGFMRVGGEKTVTVDARLMAATHRDLGQEVAEKRFLEPLYHRLNVFPITVPSLRDRKEDLPILVREVLEQLCRRMNIHEPPPIDSDTLTELMNYDWPGNVRELKNMLERALMLWDGEWFEIRLPSFPGTLDENTWSTDLPFPSYWSLRQITDEVTRSVCIEALRRAEGNKKEAARILGVSRDALYRYIKRFDIKADNLT